MGTPKNRDRLELYAWHKQAVSGDAPSILQNNANTMTAAEKSKYAAWKSKSGTDSVAAMRHYMSEAERQMRVYGTYSSNNNNGGDPSALGTNAAYAHGENNGSAPQEQFPRQPSRGLAAIPLLCAAASEHRTAYLRRLQMTPVQSAWWRRQEPLTATPGTVAALPEHVLLALAAAVEHVSLAANVEHDYILWGRQQLPPTLCAVVQSLLWPLHNALLAVWMAWIVIAATVMGAFELGTTVLLGSRRTGKNLSNTWNDTVVFASQSVGTLTESHQPLAARVVGLVLQPLPLTVQLLRTLCRDHIVYVSCLYTMAVFLTSGYWLIILPWFLVVVMLGTSLLLGQCFAVIELAGHLG